MSYDHDDLIKKVALQIEKDKGFALVKYFTPANDTKTDLIGSFYPDITCLRRAGKTKLLLEVLTPRSFDDEEEIYRLEAFSDFCQANRWEYYLVCADQETKNLTLQKIEGRNIKVKEIWIQAELPFEAGEPAGMAKQA